MKYQLEYRTNNAHDWVLLVADGLVRSDWAVTPEVLREFCDCSQDANDWDDRFGDEAKPDEYGTLIAVRRDYTLEAIDKVQWEKQVSYVLH